MQAAGGDVGSGHAEQQEAELAPLAGASWMPREPADVGDLRRALEVGVTLRVLGVEARPPLDIDVVLARAAASPGQVLTSTSVSSKSCSTTGPGLWLGVYIRPMSSVPSISRRIRSSSKPISLQITTSVARRRIQPTRCGRDSSYSAMRPPMRMLAR